MEQKKKYSSWNQVFGTKLELINFSKLVQNQFLFFSNKRNNSKLKSSKPETPLDNSRQYGEITTLQLNQP